MLITLLLAFASADSIYCTLCGDLVKTYKRMLEVDGEETVIRHPDVFCERAGGKLIDLCNKVKSYTPQKMLEKIKEKKDGEICREMDMC